MSISNNIGHDNALKDTPERNNLNDILNTYLEWKRTGKLTVTIKDNQDPLENLESPEQIWLVSPKSLTSERIDSFFYAPELHKVWADIENMTASGEIELKTGKDFTLREKIIKSG
ncbi:MAG: hypothetical protein UZ14_CFX002001762 [Chloroflexi bacterium OLB14]|nr:MAG: hypothetical protein UZ14_CFX002001762 [Chloroflexi bacterium OLB14]